MDTVTQIQSHLITHQYEGLIKKSRLGGAEMNLILFESPAAGKGTQAETCRNAAIFNCRLGQLRAAVASGSELGNKVKSILESGAALDEIVIALIDEQLDTNKGAAGFIYDGSRALSVRLKRSTSCSKAAVKKSIA